MFILLVLLSNDNSDDNRITTYTIHLTKKGKGIAVKPKEMMTGNKTKKCKCKVQSGHFRRAL